jgi:hypothetical protein
MCVSTRVQGRGQLLPAAGPEGRVEAPRDGTVTAASRCNGDGGDGTAGSVAPSRAAPLQEQKIWLFCVGQNQEFQSHHVLVSSRLRSTRWTSTPGMTFGRTVQGLRGLEQGTTQTGNRIVDCSLYAETVTTCYEAQG